MSRYTYEPLLPDCERVRLLDSIRIDPNTSQPRCELNQSRFSTGWKFDSEYSALSYTWGESTPPRSISINGHRHEVRQNLFDFFEAYLTHSWGLSKKQPRDCDGRFWIDQICINQADVDERSSQVGMMSKIYKTAKRVLVWLGNDPDMVAAARQIHTDQADHDQALHTLLSHPYFSRLWIVQEVTLAVEVEIVCGDVQLSWVSLRSAIGNYVSRRMPRTRRLEAQAMAVVMNSWRPRQTLAKCISWYCGNQCQDPRDKVYGLLGMTSERWRLQVDYSKSVVEVFLDAVMALYEELFDILDPTCYYTRAEDEDDRVKSNYRSTLQALAGAMGLPIHQAKGVVLFLEHLQEAFLKTTLRNIDFTYTGKTSQIEYENEITVRWNSVTATRRKPLLRDVIPTMGLRLNCSCTGFEPPTRDCWYFSDGSSDYHFPCPPIFDMHQIYHYQYIRITDGRSMVFNVDAPRLASTPSGPPFPPIAPRGSDFLFNGSDSYFVFPKPHQAKRL